MKLTLINFADKSFKTNQKYNSFTAKFFGRANKVISYSPEDISEYLNLHPNFKKYDYKGYGNYFWKPYIILKGLDEIEYGDFLFYSDSGAIVLKNLKDLCKSLETSNKDILAFKLPLIEKQWTKRDTFVLMNSDVESVINSNQFLCTFICIKKTKASIDFFTRFKTYCEDERIVSDLDNTQGLPNYPEFIAHRHDQSIFSIMVKNSSIVQTEVDLSDYGLMPNRYLTKPEILSNLDDFDYKNIKFKGYLISNRKEHPLKYTLKYFIKRLLKW